MQCPKCDGNRQSLSHQGVTIDICLKCNGIWYDKGELDYLEQRAKLGGIPSKE